MSFAFLKTSGNRFATRAVARRQCRARGPCACILAAASRIRTGNFDMEAVPQVDFVGHRAALRQFADESVMEIYA